jgi:hypothetical protein
MQPLTFAASWLSSPDTVAIELVAGLAAKLAQESASQSNDLQGSHLVDVAAVPRH